MFNLTNILKLNAISSGATGLLLAVFPSVVASIFGVNNLAPFIETGIFLIAFAVFVFIVSVSRNPNQKLVKTIVALDTVWVIASVFAILALFSRISMWGTVIIAAIAVWVALMAYLQARFSNFSKEQKVYHAGL